MSPRTSAIGTVLLAAALVSGAAGASMRRPRRPAPPPPEPAAKANPLLPAPIALSSLFADLALVQKMPAEAPRGFAPLYSPRDWQAYRARFGAPADALPRKRASGALEFSAALLQAAEGEKTAHPGLARLLLIRAAAVCYRNRGGFESANRAVSAYQAIMDVHSPAQVAALWTIANAMSRLAVTPRDQRIVYSGIAARANLQLAILLLDAGQIAAAQSLIKMVAYHEGWLKSDKPARTMIAQVRAAVRQTAAMMDYLATQYTPAINGDDSALMALYIYGRFVKDNPALVADFPSRKPDSPMAQLAAALAAADHDPTANFTAADTLRIVASGMPAGVLKQRAEYAALVRYRKFNNAPETIHDRVKRTLAVIAIESLEADGARPGIMIHPFDPPKPAPPPAAAPPQRSAAPATLPVAGDDGPIVG